jgi:hypothetical protein
MKSITGEVGDKRKISMFIPFIAAFSIISKKYSSILLKPIMVSDFLIYFISGNLLTR